MTLASHLEFYLSLGQHIFTNSQKRLKYPIFNDNFSVTKSLFLRSNKPIGKKKKTSIKIRSTMLQHFFLFSASGRQNADILKTCSKEQKQYAGIGRNVFLPLLWPLSPVSYALFTVLRQCLLLCFSWPLFGVCSFF